MKKKKAQTCKFIYRHPTTTWFLEAEDIFCLSQQNESLVCINDERDNYLTVISSSLNQEHYTRSKFNDTQWYTHQENKSIKGSGDAG